MKEAEAKLENAKKAVCGGNVCDKKTTTKVCKGCGLMFFETAERPPNNFLIARILARNRRVRRFRREFVLKYYRSFMSFAERNRMSGILQNRNIFKKIGNAIKSVAKKVCSAVCNAVVSTVTDAACKIKCEAGKAALTIAQKAVEVSRKAVEGVGKGLAKAAEAVAKAIEKILSFFQIHRIYFHLGVGAMTDNALEMGIDFTLQGKLHKEKLHVDFKHPEKIISWLMGMIKKSLGI